VLLERSHESKLVGACLEATMTKLGAGIDELEVDLLGETLAGQSKQRPSESQHSLLGSLAGSLNHQEVLLHLTVVNESSHGSDRLLGNIVISRAIVLDQLAVLNIVSNSDSVDLLVNNGSVMVTLLTSSGNRELDSAGMPGSNTGDLTQTLVGLTRQLLCVPSAGHTLETFTLGDTNYIQAFILAEDLRDGDCLFKVLSGPVNLFSDGSTVQLDFHNEGLPLPLVENLHLGVDNDPDFNGMLLDQVKILLNLLLTQLICPLGAVLGEGLLLGLVPGGRK